MNSDVPPYYLLFALYCSNDEGCWRPFCSLLVFAESPGSKSLFLLCQCLITCDWRCLVLVKSRKINRFESIIQQLRIRGKTWLKLTPNHGSRQLNINSTEWRFNLKRKKEEGYITDKSCNSGSVSTKKLLLHHEDEYFHKKTRGDEFYYFFL